MKFFILVTIIGLFNSNSLAQCNYVTISNQMEMDEFGCDSVYLLVLTNKDVLDPITDFSNLDFLEFVEHKVQIKNFIIYKDSIALSNLTSVSEIEIACDSIDIISFPLVDSLIRLNLSGNFNTFSISSLIWVRDKIDLRNLTKPNFQFSPIDDLNSLNTIYFNTDNVNDLSFLPTGFYPNYIHIWGDTIPINLSHFEGMTKLGDLIISGPPVESFEPLSDIKEINGLRLKYIPNMTNLDFLSNLIVSNKTMYITNNDSLTNIEGLSQLKFFAGILLQSNPILESCCVLDYLLTNVNTGPISILPNSENCNSFFEIFASCNDDDQDGIYQNDNCPNTSNPDQLDDDEDGLGNVCDDFPTGNDPSTELTNADFFISEPNKGVILKNGNNECYRVSINLDGVLKVIKINCP